MRRGEVWWAAARGPGGSSKRRPWLVVSDDLFNRNDRYEKVLVVHLTSVQRPESTFAWEVALPKGAANLDRASVVKCGEVYTRGKHDLEALIGTLPGDVMARVDRALAVALSLPYPRDDE